MGRNLRHIISVTALALVVAACGGAEPTTAPASEPKVIPGSHGARTGDHWHASLSVNVCGIPFTVPAFPAGIHSHGDGQIHIHPSLGEDAGQNATLGRFLEVSYDAGALAVLIGRIQLPGEPVYRDGDACPDGNPGKLEVSINGESNPDFLNYLLQDGDRIIIKFG